MVTVPVGASLTAVILVAIMLVVAEIAVAPPFTAVFTVVRVPPAVKVVWVLSKARTVRDGGVPL